MKNSIKIFAAFFLVITFSESGLKAEEWNVPSSAKQKQNPYDPTTKNISSGKKIFNINCKSCHGDPGMGNMLPLQPKAPTDLGSQAFLMQRDGEIFFKVNQGKGAMPTFEKTLSSEEKWMVITYLRSMDENKKATEKIAEIKNPEVTNVKLDLQTQDENKKLIAQLSGITKKGDRVGLQGIELSFLVKRNFGYLDISGNDAYTDENGNVEISFPSDLPGDREGHVTLLVKITDDAYYGAIEESRIASLGVPTSPVNPLNERAMWGTRANAPIWIIATYLGGVIGIWGIIFFVLFQMIQLPKLAKSKE